MNTLYYGDNLKILRDYIKDESVDLVYLDPPFNSNRNYNVLFRNESGSDSESQITAFEDTQKRKGADTIYDKLIFEGHKASELLRSFQMDTMNLLPQPPTDNLYKFMAISGLLLVLLGLGAPAFLNYRAYISNSEMQGRMRLLQAEKEMVFNDFIMDLSSRTVTTEDLDRFRARSKDLILRSVEIDNEDERSLRELKVSLIVAILAIFPLLVGHHLMFRNFALWKSKLQDHQDMIVENEAKSRGGPSQIQVISEISSAPPTAVAPLSASLLRSKKRPRK